MSVEGFARHSEVLTLMTSDFASAVPEDRLEFTPVPPSSVRAPLPGRIGDGFAPFSKQLRHVVCARGVYNDALANGKVDWSRSHDHYTGPLERDALLEALAAQQQRLEALLEELDPDPSIDWDGSPFDFDMFAGEFVQHEAIHHGQWSVYAALAGFDTPPSWQQSWGL